MSLQHCNMQTISSNDNVLCTRKVRQKRDSNTQYWDSQSRAPYVWLCACDVRRTLCVVFLILQNDILEAKKFRGLRIDIEILAQKQKKIAGLSANCCSNPF